MLLVAGGQSDPNLRAVLAAAKEAEADPFALLVGEGSSPSVSWDLNSGELRVDGQRLDARAAFCRPDVFDSGAAGARQRAFAWHHLLQAWLASCPNIRVLNRAYIGRQTLKLEMLLLARAVGLRVPDTIATNEMSRVLRFRDARDAVAKPVGGGGFCRVVADLLDETELRGDAAACPAIVQERLRGPDVRVFAVGEDRFAFQIHSEGVDYRASGTARIDRFKELPPSTMAALARLLAAVGLEWAAADFKVEAGSGELVFLEVNSNPMFSVFDSAADGEISKSIVRRLAGLPNPGVSMNSRAEEGGAAL